MPFPDIIAALKRLPDGFGSQPIALDLKGPVGPLVTSYDYQRAGFYGMAAKLGYGNTAAGVSLTWDGALEIPAVYSCVKIIAEDMGAMPHVTYQRSADRKTTDQATDHPLFSMLKNLWNPDVSAGEGVEALTAQACLGLDGFAKFEKVGRSRYLWPYAIGEMRVERDDQGHAHYYEKIGNQEEKQVNRRDVFHLKGLTFNGVTGEKVLIRAREAIGLSIAMQNYAATYFKSDATPGIVISRPRESGVLNKEGVELFKEAWILHHRQRPHEPALLQEGMTASAVATNASDAQMNEQRASQLAEVCRLFRMPPHKIADLSRMTNNNIEQLAIEYITNTLNPWIERWKRAVYRCLLTIDEQSADRIYAEHDVSILLRGDFASQAEGWRKLLEKGVLSINQVRRWLNLNPVPGGDEHFIQLNLGTVQDVAAGLTLQKVTPAA